MATSLTETQLSTLKGRLTARRDELLAQVREELLRADEEQYGDLAGQVHDMEDQSAADLLADLNLASIDQHIEELRAVDRALMRMGQSSYGYCVDCGQPIEHERLSAYPTADRCLDCQAAREHNYAQKGHPRL
jgi:DnaK suppressor protein